MQSNDLTETYTYGTNEDIIDVKEKMKHCNIMQRCLTLAMSQKKT